jgi:hypothetical protein
MSRSLATSLSRHMRAHGHATSVPGGHAHLAKWLLLLFSAFFRLAPLASSIPYLGHALAVSLNTRLVHTERANHVASFLAVQAKDVTMPR